MPIVVIYDSLCLLLWTYSSLREFTSLLIAKGSLVPTESFKDWLICLMLIVQLSKYSTYRVWFRGENLLYLEGMFRSVSHINHFDFYFFWCLNPFCHCFVWEVIWKQNKGLMTALWGNVLALQLGAINSSLTQLTSAVISSSLPLCRVCSSHPDRTTPVLQGSESDAS